MWFSVFLGAPTSEFIVLCFQRTFPGPGTKPSAGKWLGWWLHWETVSWVPGTEALGQLPLSGDPSIILSISLLISKTWHRAFRCGGSGSGSPQALLSCILGSSLDCVWLFLGVAKATSPECKQVIASRALGEGPSGQQPRPWGVRRGFSRRHTVSLGLCPSLALALIPCCVYLWATPPATQSNISDKKKS